MSGLPVMVSANQAYAVTVQCAPCLWWLRNGHGPITQLRSKSWKMCWASRQNFCILQSEETWSYVCCVGMWVLELLSHLYETLTNRRVWPKRTTRNDLALYSLWGSQLEAPPTSGFQWSYVCCVGMWVLELLSHLWHWQTGGFGPRGPQEMIWHCIASGEVNLRLPLPRAFSQVCFW